MTDAARAPIEKALTELREHADYGDDEIQHIDELMNDVWNAAATALADENSRLAAELEAVQRWTSADKPLPEDDAIRAAFPTRTGKHATYAEAMRMVSAKSSKVALVALVNWLLCERDKAESESARLAARVAELRTAIEPFAKVEIDADGWSNLEPEHFAAARAAYEASA